MYDTEFRVLLSTGQELKLKTNDDTYQALCSFYRVYLYTHKNSIFDRDGILLDVSKIIYVIPESKMR